MSKNKKQPRKSGHSSQKPHASATSTELSPPIDQPAPAISATVVAAPAPVDAASRADVLPPPDAGSAIGTEQEKGAAPADRDAAALVSDGAEPVTPAPVEMHAVEDSVLSNDPVGDTVDSGRPAVSEMQVTEKPVASAPPPEPDVRELIIRYDARTSAIIDVCRPDPGGGAATPLSNADIAQLLTVGAIPNAGDLAVETGRFSGGNEHPVAAAATAYYQGVLDYLNSVNGAARDASGADRAA